MVWRDEWIGILRGVEQGVEIRYPNRYAMSKTAPSIRAETHSMNP